MGTRPKLYPNHTRVIPKLYPAYLLVFEVISLLFIIDFLGYYHGCRFIVLGNGDNGNFITEGILVAVK